MRTRLLLSLLFLSGCALEPGESFAVLEPAVRADYTPVAGRDAGNGFQRLASDFELRLDGAALGVDHIDLVGGGGTRGPTTFDPANPPPGYTNCHNGHCHHDDGSLVDYEDIQAELDGGGGGAEATVASLHVDADLDLLADQTLSPGCEPSCELGRTHVSRYQWDVSSVNLEGAVRDSRATPRFNDERRFRLALAAAEEATPLMVLRGTVDIPADRENKPRVKLALRLALAPTLFDSLDWAATTPGPDGVVDLNAPENAAIRTAMVEALAALEPQAEVRREDR
ncbi:hypothetical protein [Myxococcus virescens]|uniref:Lipoprotein n=1 Tax=Myxococcus virescens TaxID=83456 RepID=A0A511HEH0_9BACT|nr:hypothetical protein [Myxococcus virescens]GEL71947.1 hypothetical protein MVI01_37310 [Myxococcus virescens]SDE80396.1 hypothetical protein SAMN04488504_11273 [Myxococcus virescens]